MCDGWCVAGLAIEFAIDKKLGVKVRLDVLDITVKNYNAQCRSRISPTPETLNPKPETLKPQS